MIVLVVYRKRQASAFVAYCPSGKGNLVGWNVSGTAKALERDMAGRTNDEMSDAGVGQRHTKPGLGREL